MNPKEESEGVVLKEENLKIEDNEDNIEIFDGQIEDENALYQTGEIGKQLGVSRDLVRLTVNEFKEFFNPVYTKKGKGAHMRLNNKDIELLKTIFYLKKTKTVPEIKALMSDESVKMLIVNGSETEQLFATLLLENNKYLLKSILKEFQPILEDKQKIKQIEETLQEQLDEERLKNRKMEEKLDTLLTSFTEQEKLLQELINQTEQQKQKKGFFGLRLIRK